MPDQPDAAPSSSEFLHPPLVEPTMVPSTDGVEVAVYDFGGSGPLLMLCHATGFCGGYWEPIARRLNDRFHCIAIDFRGHGRTAFPAGLSMAWAGMGEDLLAAIDHARTLDGVDSAGPVFAAGHSMGGASIVLAELARPGTIAKAWAVEPILFPTPEGGTLTVDGRPVHDSPLVAGARRRRPEFESRAAVFERYGSRPPFGHVDRDMLRAYIDYGFRDLDDGGVRLRCEPESEAQVFENSLCGAFERLASVEIDFQVVASGDGESPAAIAPTVVAQNPRFELLDYPELTHFAPLEDPDRVAADIAAWFA